MSSRRFPQRLPISAIRTTDPARESRDALVFGVLAILASLAAGLVGRAWPQPLWGAAHLSSDATYVFGFKFGVLLLMPLVWLARRGYRFPDLLLGWHPTPRALVTVLASYLAGASINAGKLAPILAAARRLPPAEAAGRMAAGWIVVGVTAGLAEELGFRWGVQTRLERTWGRLPALLVTAVLFTAWHLPSRYVLASGAEGRAGDFGSVLLGTGLPVFVVALLLGWAWDRWRNLPALVAFHWGVDTLVSIASFLKIASGSH